MDSMRHLSTSLPRASSRRSEPPSDLLSDFKAAALSVTNLYKTAATSQARARAAGYQDAVDDLLQFLDRENLGLMDGEGWKVRQWATEKLDGDGTLPRQSAAAAGSNTTDDEEEVQPAKDEEKEEERSSSPEAQRKPPTLPITSSLVTEDDTLTHRRVASEPPQPLVRVPQEHPLSGEFTFRSPYAYPANHDRDGNSGMEVDVTAPPSAHNSPGSNSTATESVRIIPRPTRGNRHNRRNDNRQPTLNLNLGAGAGSKRKAPPYHDFFDISGFQDGTERKDGGGSGRGGKRGRHA